MIRRLKFVFIIWLLLVTPVFAQDKVDVVALRNGITQGTITVSTSATAIPTTAFSGRRSIIIVNISANIIYIGASNVTTANGYALYQLQSISIDLADNVTIYGIASGSSECRYLEIR